LLRLNAYLQQTVDDLAPYIVPVGAIEVTFQQAEDAFRDAVVGLEVFGCAPSAVPGAISECRITFVAGGDVEEGAQRVVDYLHLVLVAARRHDLI
jgi:hypothetical protein